MKSLFALLALLLFASFASADGIAVPLPGVAQVEYYIDFNTYIPLLGNLDRLLADNLLDAQKKADLDQSDSMLLSEESLIRATQLQKEWGSVAACDRWDCPIVWAQSNIAINDQAHVTLWPPDIDFGKKTIVTPEPSTLTLMTMVLLLLPLGRYVSQRKAAHGRSL